MPPERCVSEASATRRAEFDRIVDYMEENNKSFDNLVRLLGEEIEKSDGSSSILQSLLQSHPEAQNSLEQLLANGIEKYATSVKQWGKSLAGYKPIEQVKKEYLEKNEYIVNAPRLDSLDLTEITQGEFIEYLFERDVRFEREIQPFEDKESKEYLHWLMQKKMGVKVLDYRGYSCWRYNPIVFIKQGKANKHRILLKNDDGESLDYIENLQLDKGDFAILSPVTYVGRNNTAQNARYLYAMAFDLDGVGIKQLNGLMRCVELKLIPMPNIIVSSGHGLHLYFLLRDPVPLYMKNHEVLNKLKKGLTDKIWNDLTSEDENIQYQGVLQSFRLPGTTTKFGQKIRAFHSSTAPMYSIEELNGYVIDSKKLSKDELKQLVEGPVYNPTGIVLSEAKERWPEWYTSKVLQKRRIGKKWHVKRDVYDWWLRILRGTKDEVKLHHRYWCIMTLVVYAVKCDIPREEVYADAISLVDKFDALTEVEDNHFTAEDVDDAMRAFDENYNTWPIDAIEKTTLIHIERGRRNGRDKYTHLKRIRAMQNVDYPKGEWRNGNGRKKGSSVTLEDSRCANIVKKWREEHPDSKNKSECARDTGLTRPTVRKWWDAFENGV